MIKRLVLGILIIGLVAGCTAQVRQERSFIGMTEVPVTVVTSPVTGMVVAQERDRVAKGDVLMQVVTGEQQLQAVMAPNADIKEKAEQASRTAKAINKEADAYLAEMTTVYRRALNLQAQGLMGPEQVEETKKLYLKALERQQKARYLHQQVEQEAESASQQARRTRLAGEDLIPVKSPSQGIVQRTFAATGQTVIAGMPLCEIREEGPAQVIVYIQGSIAKTLQAKEQVWLYPEGSEPSKVQGVIQCIKPVASGAMPHLAMEQGLYRVEIVSSAPIPEECLIRVEVKS